MHSIIVVIILMQKYDTTKMTKDARNISDNCANANINLYSEDLIQTPVHFCSWQALAGPHPTKFLLLSIYLPLKM